MTYIKHIAVGNDFAKIFRSDFLSYSAFKLEHPNGQIEDLGPFSDIAEGYALARARAKPITPQELLLMYSKRGQLIIVEDKSLLRWEVLAIINSKIEETGANFDSLEKAKDAIKNLDEITKAS